MTLQTYARRLLLPLTVTLLALGTVAGSARAGTPAFAYEPISVQRINLPISITSASQPEFTADGTHLLFFSGDDLWIVGLDGSDPHCLSCGLANDPDLSFLATPFPDGKRIFFGGDIQPGTTRYGVLQCTPSVVDCEQKQIDPVDFAAAEPTVIPAGGAEATPQSTLPAAGYHAKLSQDGNYVGFSEIRTDSIETMVVARLEQSGSQYIVADPKVINPPGPTSATDANPEAWSDSSGLFEFKSFTDGGADATYVESGGPSLLNPDTWSVNLATGQRTRLTSNADWNEDNGISPNGNLLSVFSDQTMHYVDWIGGMMPVPDFIDGAASAQSAGAFGGSSACMGPMWLQPASGDDDGAVAGQPLDDLQYPHVHATDEYQGWNQWSPNGTMVTLNMVDDSTGKATPFLLVAHLDAVKPSAPLPAVSSEPGNWAQGPATYHPALGHIGTVTLTGPGGGTVTVDYGAGNVLAGGQWSETYDNYSQDGRDIINGTVTITGTAVEGTYTAHLTMTGADTGSDEANLTFGLAGVSGSAVDTYDGNMISGPLPVEASGVEADGGASTACPALLPKEPVLHVTPRSLGHGRYRLRVTASVAGVGPNEAMTDTSPVQDATVTVGRATAYTSITGTATITAGTGRSVSIGAGDTLSGTSAQLCAPGSGTPTASITKAQTRAGRGRITLSGTAGDVACHGTVNGVRAAIAGTVRRVGVSVARLDRDGRCSDVTRRGRLAAPGSCQRARILLTARGTAHWRLALRSVRLPAGTYEVFAQARDGAGHVSGRRAGVGLTRVRIR